MRTFGQARLGLNWTELPTRRKEQDVSDEELIYKHVIERLENASSASGTKGSPDRRDGEIYDWDEALHLAIEVALVTSRPLLLLGEPGSGKSSLAAFVARNLKWRYYEYTVTSETRSRDLLWRFDAVRRLADAQVRGKDDAPLNDAHYVEPGVLWWVFAPDQAKDRGSKEPLSASRCAVDPHNEINAARDQQRAVVLIDELDKADPDVPNGLLSPLGSTHFVVRETGTSVRWSGPKGEEPGPIASILIVITSNEERRLPEAFLRRCVVHRLDHPSGDRLVKIAQLHLCGMTGELTEEQKTLCRQLAEQLDEARILAKREGRRPPSTAEYLDSVRACLRLGVTPDLQRATWKAIEQSVLHKRDN